MPRRKPFVIDHSTDNDLLFDPVVDGERKGRGYDPSFIDAGVKAEMRALPSTIKIIPRSEWDARYEEQEARKSSLTHLKFSDMANGKPHNSLDQNGEGFCWNYSCNAAAMYARAAAHLPYVRFSPHAGACVIKNFRDEGGWCGLSARFAMGKDPKHPDKRGFMPEDRWPQKSMSRSFDTTENWRIAAEYTLTEAYIDLAKGPYDQTMLEEQIATCLFNNIPVIVDYNEWGHSIVAIRWKRVESGVFVPEIDNSWTPGWGDRGTGQINRRWNVDGAVAVLVVGPEVAA
jgi:hypothetical protein